MTLLNKLAYLRNRRRISGRISDFLDKQIYDEFEDVNTHQTYETQLAAFDSRYVEFDAEFLHALTLGIYKEMCTMGNPDAVSAKFANTLSHLITIRIDMTDSDIKNTSLNYDFQELKEQYSKYIQSIKTNIHKANNLINMAAQDGKRNKAAEERLSALTKELNEAQTSPIKNAVSTPAFNILVPALSPMLHSGGDVVESILSFIHEFIHTLTRTSNNVGIWFRSKNGNFERGIWDDINEGLTEYIAEKMCKKIIKNKNIKNYLPHNQNSFLRRYVLRVDLVKDLLKLFPEGKIEELFLTGNSEAIISMFKSTFNENNESLYDLLNSYPKGDNIIRGGEDKASEKAKNDLCEKLKHFKYLRKESTQND